MKANENQKSTREYKVYIHRLKTWVDVTEEQYYAYYRDIWATRKRAQAHGRCMCPKTKIWMCDGDCLVCEFRAAGDTLSLDYAAYVVELLETAKQTCSDPVVMIEQRVNFTRWVQDGFGTAEGKDIYCASASQMFGVPVEKHGINGHLRQKGKIAELALGYGGSVGALKAMGAIEMGLSEEELPPLVDAWRQANPNITKLWWDVDRAAMEAVRYKHTNETHGIEFSCRSGMLFITLPSGRQLAYVKPKIGMNKFGGDCITYEGVGGTKKWERLDSYGPKFVENIVQATARDILCYAMNTLRCCSIVMHIHDEVVIEANPRMSLQAICDQMGRTPPWAKRLQIRADGYETQFYKKD